VLFGVTVSRALNVNNLRAFSDRLSAAVQKAVQTRAHEVGDALLARAETFSVKGPRQTTAQAVSALLQAVDTRDPVAQVNALSGAQLLTSPAAVQKHIASADSVLHTLHDDMRFGAFEALLPRTDAAATTLLQQVREVLSRDEVAEPLSVRLNHLGLQAQRLITGAADKPPTSAKVIAHGDRRDISAAGATTALDAVRGDAIKALNDAAEGARLSIEWKVEKS
jgi:hypothetical protein